MKTRYLLACALLALISCERVEVPSVSGDDNTVYHGMIELGERLEDPYSVDNITKALENLYPTKGRVEIQPTDLYLRFLPQTEEQYRLLESSVPAMADHPLDYRIVREGDYYHDPSVPEGEITWQYVVVPSDYSVPEGLKCELIDKCYISEHDAFTRAGLSDVDW